MRTRFFYLILILGGIFVTSCERDLADTTQTTPDTEEAIIDTNLGDDLEEFNDGEVDQRFFDNFTFFTLSKALECTALTDAVFSGRKTVYAPSDAAFRKLGLNRHNICDLDAQALTDILVYHVADGIVGLNQQGCVELLDGNIAQLQKQGRRRIINDSRIYLKWTQRGRDYRVRFYAINEVLTPPTTNIATTASQVDNFATLFAAVLAADPSVAAALSDENAIWTVFAPSNQAFADLLGVLGFTSLEDLVAGIGVENLTKVLLYHVVDGCAFSNDLEDGQKIPTLLDDASVEIDLSNLAILDDTSDPSQLNPEFLDVLTSNGVVHGIEKVLLPQEVLDALSGE